MIVLMPHYQCTSNVKELDKSHNDSIIKKTKDTAINLNVFDTLVSNTCQQNTCHIWLLINLSEQRLYLYENGINTDTFQVSTGDSGFSTPLMDRRIKGKMYKKYSSKKYPGGDYKGLGNMPYAIFIRGGYAIHGTTPGNFEKLGTVAAKGCIRLHPDHAKKIFELIEKYGKTLTWVSVIDG